MHRLHGLWGVVGGVMLLVAMGCSDGPAGDDGQVLVNFAASSNVSQVTLTGVGINVVASAPDASTVYRVDALQGRIDWRSAAIDYTVVVDIDGEEGEPGTSGVLPAGSLGCNNCPPLVQGEGDDGSDKRYTLLFNGSQVLRFSNPVTITGS